MQHDIHKGVRRHSSLSLSAKKILLLVLVVICLVLVVMQFINRSAEPTSEQARETLSKLPEQETVKEKAKGDEEAHKYRVYYITIEKIENGTYSGTTKEGTGIKFSDKNLNEPIPSNLKKGDIVKAYFDLEYSTKGLVKVEKVDEMPDDDESSS